MKNAMTVQKELFIQGLLMGKNQFDAYLFAFPEAKKMNRRTVANKASLLAKRPEVIHRMDEIQNQAQEDTAVTLNRFVQELQKIALAGVNTYGLKISDKLRAMELLSKVLGFDQSVVAPDYEDTGCIDQQILAYRGPKHDTESEDQLG